MMKRSVLTLVFFAAFIGHSAYAGMGTDTYGGRSMYVYTPSSGTPGKLPLVVVLHGGMGNASHIAGLSAEKGLNMDQVAEKYGFAVAYLNGTPVTRMFGDKFLGWNAGGGCCGQSFAKNIDDVGYISGAVDYLAQKYGIDKKRVYGIGHSNGAMMTQRLMCQTDLYAAAISISGPLNIKIDTCPGAKGKKILDIHGIEDKNVPISGGEGSKGLSHVTFTSEDYTKQVYTHSGAAYDLDALPDTDHSLNNIEATIQKTEGISLQEKTARYFDLAR